MFSASRWGMVDASASSRACFSALVRFLVMFSVRFARVAVDLTSVRRLAGVVWNSIGDFFARSRGAAVRAPTLENFLRVGGLFESRGRRARGVRAMRSGADVGSAAISRVRSVVYRAVLARS